MSDDEITTMIITACIHNGIAVTGITIKNRTVVVEALHGTVKLKRSGLPGRTVGDVGAELQRALGAIV